MINAYILIMMKPGNTDKAITEMRKIGNVEKISVVAGEYDIEKTTTQVIEKELAL